MIINPVILASASPRRKMLLEQVGIPCTVQPSTVAEKVTHTDPSLVVEELSEQKCEDVALRSDGTKVVIGSDTVVALEGKILGKPKDTRDAFRMISMLQGNTHQVFTGVTMMRMKDGFWIKEIFHEKTDVAVYPMTDEEINWYIATGEPMDKAGAYGIQGAFARFVKKTDGDYNNVVGLPVSAVYQRLKKWSK